MTPGTSCHLLSLLTSLCTQPPACCVQAASVRDAGHCLERWTCSGSAGTQARRSRPAHAHQAHTVCTPCALREHAHRLTHFVLVVCVVGAGGRHTWNTKVFSWRSAIWKSRCKRLKAYGWRAARLRRFRASVMYISCESMARVGTFSGVSGCSFPLVKMRTERTKTPISAIWMITW